MNQGWFWRALSVDRQHSTANALHLYTKTRKVLRQYTYLKIDQTKSLALNHRFWIVLFPDFFEKENN